MIVYSFLTRDRLGISLRCLRSLPRVPLRRDRSHLIDEERPLQSPHAQTLMYWSGDCGVGHPLSDLGKKKQTSKKRLPLSPMVR